MNLCDKDHDEVCYDGWQCPACALVAEIASLKDELEGLRA